MLSIIVDTDVGYDDLLAILCLMNRHDITIEAFTVLNGISPVVEGAKALLSLQEMLGIHPYIPVYLASGQQSFTLPDSFRGEATSLEWKPPARPRPSSKNAEEWLSTRFQEQDATVLAIGPLTNLAQVLPPSHLSDLGVKTKASGLRHPKSSSKTYFGVSDAPNER